MPSQKPSPAGGPASADASTPRYRSGAVARMVRMPVATLRIWERRYQVTAPATTESGHRLYSAADVQRLAVLKQLTEHGHAIGALAALDMTQLQKVASTHANTLAGTQRPSAASPVPWRVVVVGAALAKRLQRPGLAQRLGRPLQVVAAFDGLDDAAQAPTGPRADTLLCDAPGLSEAALPALAQAARAWRVRVRAMVYGYAATAASAAFAAAGVMLLRGPQSDASLAAWLAGLAGPSAARDTGSGARSAFTEPMGWVPGEVAPRRYDDAMLTELAGLSSTIVCECPRHVAELLMQLSHFEAYSADCEHRSPSDAALHAYLQRVAGASRALFESALARVAIHEGLMLPR
jgi:MerR family transcriptional regulator, light-induced transcriptional regulator